MSRPGTPAGRPTRPPRRTPSSSQQPAQNPSRAGDTGPRRGRPGKPVADPARMAAFETLRAVHDRDAYANLVLPGLLRQAGLHGRDAGFATELAYGTLRGLGSYDAVLAACTDRQLSALDDEVLDALRLGVHQVIGMRMPAHAAVTTTVDLVRATSGPGASRFANAIMRRVTERDPLTWIESVAPDEKTDPDGHLAILTSHPEWIVRALRDALAVNGRPARDLLDVLAANNERPLVTAAALPGLTTRDELVAAGAAPGRLSPYAATITGAPDAMSAVREGRARIQDEGSQLVALALAAAPIEGPDAGRWLDLCAGPGGKAALLGALLAQRHTQGAVTDDAELVAVEVSEHRADLVAQALSPVPVAFSIRVADGRQAAQDQAGRFDRVLVDAPCTGLGALRRRPEARWRRVPADLATLAPLQRGLLDAALDAVRPGGVVAYATCSPHRGETRTAVDDVLRARAKAGKPGAVRIDVRDVLAVVIGDRHGRAAIGGFGPGPDVQLWTDLNGTDAMYISLLRREA
jgi:16S rRNA (cytosine967-C5)-methyltransferase